MFRKILAGTDGSDSATLALGHAVDVAERLEAELTVLTAHTDHRSPAVGATGPGDEVIAGALLRDGQAAYGSRVQLRTRAAAGNAADVLIDVAEQESHDLVVVGNRGLPNASTLQPSSVPGRVSRRAPAAVLVVDTMGRRPPGYHRILAGTDGSPTAEVAERTAIELAERLGAEIELAAAGSSEAEAARSADGARTRHPGLTIHGLTGEPSGVLSNLAESGRYDLLILGNKGMTGFRRALGSVPARVLRRAPTSVLIVHTTG